MSKASHNNCHTSVTSDDTITVMIMNHKVTEKNIEDSGRITS